MHRFDTGQASIQPVEPVVAGSFMTITFTYTAGHPIDDSGYVKIAFRSVSDFGVPQFNDPAAPNYCTIATTGNCRIEPRWDPAGHIRPWGRALFMKVVRGYLDRGETISVLFGDRSGGSQGWRVPTFCLTRFEFKTLVDPIATYQFKELPSSPALRIVPGEPVKAVCVAPSQLRIDEAFIYHLKLEDRWGNPTGRPHKMSHPGWSAPGVQVVESIDEETRLIGLSNPIDVRTEDTLLHPYWADFHGQTEETVGSNSIEEYFVFARDYGLLSIAAHQGNDFQITDAFWEKINQTSIAFYEPGAFVTFPGYEWSGNTPLGGDRNVFFTSEGGKITRSSTELLPDNYSHHEDSPTAAALFDNLAKQDDPEPFGFAHVGGRYSDMEWHDPAIELAVEVHSAWGTFEWLVEDALRRGYRIGICANSDGHKCRPGASYPGASSFGSLGGLTCVLARQLNRESVFEALKARHFFATTGNRCLVDVKVVAGDAGDGMMGDVIQLGRDTPHLHVRVIGTAPIESVEVRNGLNIIETLRPFGPEELGSRVKIVWSGAEVRGRDRKVRWDGGLRLRGNAILDATPVNFWNASQPLEKISRHELAWQSITSGGTSGVILQLAEPTAGTLDIHTLPQRCELDIASVRLEPEVWDCGGLRKKIMVYRLPDRQRALEFSFALPLTNLHEGDNPIYVRLTQEDGHMAWSSPLFLVQ